jgi:hypothetical protein
MNLPGLLQVIDTKDYMGCWLAFFECCIVVEWAGVQEAPSKKRNLGCTC